MSETRMQFIADARDIVDRLYDDLEQLRAFRSQGRQRRELAARIFRHVHTLKGSAASLDLKAVSNIAHEFEGVLDGVRLGRVTIDDELLNLFEDTTDLIADGLANTGGAEESNARARIAQLHAIAEAASRQGAISSSLRAALPETIARALSEYDLQHAREAVREGAKLFTVQAAFAIDSLDTRFRELSRLLGKTGEVIATVPGQQTTADEISFQLLYAAELITEQTRRLAVELGAADFTELEIGIVQPADKAQADSIPSLPQTAAVTTSVRVALNQLDDLTAEVTDLLRDTTNAFSAARASTDSSVADIANSNLRRRFVQLEERLIKLRLVPLGDLLRGAAARAGRVAARQLKKDIEFQIIGGDVGIDKALADVIGEPLTHLVRNSVGHGIETPEERIAAGKPPAGRVTLQGFSEGSRIYIIVADDGRGIDLNRVATTAAQQGIVNRPEDLSTDQAMRLIFRPGFSTSQQVSDLSGRGIGLEIVDRAMAQAGGEVRLTSEPGIGSTFAMMIPATLALVPCVVVRSGEQLYCFDSAVIADRGMLSAEQIVQTNGSEEISWEGEQLPLLRLRELLAQPAASDAIGPRAILVCEPREHRHALAAHQEKIAIAVDAIAGQHETLVRSLGPHATFWHGISGAAELLDGNVALMIDVARLIEANET
jgi:two-component system chemotaxis sensor kinase CheA